MTAEQPKDPRLEAELLRRKQLAMQQAAQQQQIRYVLQVPPGHEVRPKRSPYKAAAVVAVSIIIAGLLIASAIYLAPEGAGEPQDDDQDDDTSGGVHTDIVQYVMPGDYLRYSAARGDSAPVEGYVLTTFHSLDATSCQAAVTSNIFGFEDSNGTYEYSMKNGVFTSAALTGEVIDPTNLVGEERISTMFGQRDVVHYRYDLNGLLVDHYVLKGTGIPVKSVTSLGSSSIVLELDGTSLAWIGKV